MHLKFLISHTIVTAIFSHNPARYLETKTAYLISLTCGNSCSFHTRPLSQFIVHPLSRFHVFVRSLFARYTQLCGSYSMNTLTLRTENVASREGLVFQIPLLIPLFRNIGGLIYYQLLPDILNYFSST